MDKAELSELKEDRLANNAVVALLGALLLGQSWQTWQEGTAKLLGIIVVPSSTGFVVFIFMAVLFVWSMSLVLAAIVGPLQHLGLRTLRDSSHILGPFMLLSFVLSLLAADSELPADQWWSVVLSWGGVVMFGFLLYRIGFRHQANTLLKSLYEKLSWYVLSKPKDDAKPDGGDHVERSEAPKLSTRFLERMRSLYSHCRWPESRGFWVSVSMAIGVGGLLVVFISWDWLSEGTSRSEVIRNVGLLVAGLVAFPLAIWRALVADRQASAAQRQTATAQQGLLNERYQKGADMLGSEILSVRLGGIYALQSLAWEYSEQYYVQCMRLLCAFVRNPPKHEVTEGDREVDDQLGLWKPKLRQDVQAIMDMMRSRNETHIALEKQKEFTLDLSDADLSDSFLYRVNLTRSELTRANLSGAYLKYANLSGASLSGANLSSARLAGADLSGTAPIRVILSGTHFCDEGLSDSPTSPTIGLTQYFLDLAYSDPDNPPVLDDDARDARTGRPLVWRGKPLEGG